VEASHLSVDRLALIALIAPCSGILSCARLSREYLYVASDQPANG